MKTNYKQRTMTSTENHRSYFDWGSNMQVIREGNGDIAMTESELARFFGVTWRKLNGRLQAIAHNPNLYPDERIAGEEDIYANEQLKGYAQLYPLPIIIALSFQLDSTEAHLFRSYICHKIQRPTTTITPIFLTSNTDN